MFTFLLVLQALVAAAMIGVILMQQSEGGGLGVGGSPSGLLSARGAANFLTRATAILATVFVGLSIILGALASRQTTGTTLDTSLSRGAAANVPAPAPAAPVDPLSAAAAAAAGTAPTTAPTPAPATTPTTAPTPAQAQPARDE